MIKNLKAKVSVFLIVFLIFSTVSSTFTVVLAEEGGTSIVSETDSHILIKQDHYHLEIEKAGFKYSFQKPDGTVIVDQHNTSGLRFTEPGEGTLHDVVSTELLSHSSDVVNMLVTNSEGGKAQVRVHLFDHYMKFEIVPEADGGSLDPIIEGLLTQTDTAGESFMTAGDATWTNYTLEAAMKAGNVDPGASASGLVFRYQDYNNFYHVRLHNSNGEIQLLKKVDGAFNVVHRHPASVARDQWYDLKVELDDNVITVYLNGTEQFSYTDLSDVITAGAIGIRTYKDNVSFKDFAVHVDGEVVFEDKFASDNLEDWDIRSGNWSLSQTDIIQTYIIDARTAPLSPAYGLGDHGRNGHSTNVFGFSNNDMTNKGGEERFISNFTIFPAHGFAQVLFEEGKKRVTINATENKLGVADVERVNSLYYFIGDMEQIYKDYQTVRYEEGYPDYLPKYEFFEVGYEAFGSLGWNTYQSSVTEDLQTYLKKGYDLKWAVVGSGFWKGDRSKANEGSTTSFGIWDDELEEGRNDSLPNPRYPDINGFKSFLEENDIKLFLGLRVNFKALPEDGGNHYFVHDGPFTQEGIERGYFLKDANGKPLTYTVNFPKGNVYILDTNNEDALDWYVSGANLWEVDGFKEDTMMQSRLYQDGLWNRSNAKLMEAGNYVMVRNAAYSIPGDIIRLEDTQHGFNQDRPIINALNYAASGAPNVYSDIIAGKYLTTPLTEDQKIYFVRNAMFAALTPATSVGLGPWKMENEQYEAAVKKAVDFHSMYAPYIYSAAVDSYHTGFPHTMTPLPIAYPDDAETYELANRSTRQYEWLLGPSMLAAPAYGHDYATVTARDVYLPEGQWIDYETGVSYQGPTILEGYELPIDKIPVFIGGKGVIVNRELHGDQLFAEVFPIAKDGSTYRFTYPDGISTSVIRNDNVNWNPETLKITDTTTNEEVEFIYNEVTGSFKFPLTAGHDYVLTDGEFEEILSQVDISLDKRADLLVGEEIELSIEGKLLSGEDANLSAAHIQYYSDNESAVSIDERGQITAVSTGTANIKAVVTMNGVAVESNPITINVVEPEIKIRSPQHSSEFTSQPITIAGQSTGFEQLELRINGMIIPVNVSDSGEWEYHIGQLPNGVLGIQVLGRDMSGKIRATDAIHISILLDEVLYRTNFTGDNREWQVVNGDWSVSSDGSTTTYTASGNGLTYTGDAEWGDYQIESSILIHTPSPTQGGGASGIVFRYQDSGNFYHYRLDHLMRVEGQYLKSAQLYKWVDGAAVKIAEVPYEYEYDEWYDMKVIVEGDNIKAYLNDELIIEENDSSLHQGQIGFRTNGRSFATSGVTVKNILSDPLSKTPTWIDATLNATDVGTTEATLLWSGAMDLEEITTYRIIQNGVQGAPLAAADLTVTNNVYSVTDSVYGYTVTGLTPETEYVFKLEAGNRYGQWSVDGPVMTVLTLPEQIAEPIDTEAPTWHADSVFTASDISTNQLRLFWTPATDNEAVTGYRIYQDGAILTEVGSNVLTLEVTGLSANTTYSFKVEAVDAAGNWSTDGPSVTVTTDAGRSPRSPVLRTEPRSSDSRQPAQEPRESDEQPVQVELLDDVASASLAEQGTGDSAKVRLAGKVYEVTFSQEEAEGVLPEPVAVTLAYDATDVDEELLGVYYYNEESEQWEYMGGEIARENAHFTVEITKAGIYAVLEYDKSFTDVTSDHWVYAALKQLAARHIVNGVSEEEFAPEGPMTRAEFAVLLVRLLGVGAESASLPFADVPHEAWYAEEVAAAYGAGLINGMSEAEFGPNERISREQMAAMVIRVYEYVQGVQAPKVSKLGAYVDGQSVSDWAQTSVDKALVLGIMKGKGSSQFAPQDEATRAEAVMVIWNLLQLIP